MSGSSKPKPPVINLPKNYTNRGDFLYQTDGKVNANEEKLLRELLEHDADNNAGGGDASLLPEDDSVWARSLIHVSDADIRAFAEDRVDALIGDYSKTPKNGQMSDYENAVNKQVDLINRVVAEARDVDTKRVKTNLNAGFSYNASGNGVNTKYEIDALRHFYDYVYSGSSSGLSDTPIANAIQKDIKNNAINIHKINEYISIYSLNPAQIRELKELLNYVATYGLNKDAGEPARINNVFPY